MLFFIVGASGSGKTACISKLRELLPNAGVQDFDDIDIPENAGTTWRQKATEKWLQRYLEESNSYDIYCICGQVVLGEILACPTSQKIPKINVCLLDVSDVERIKRLKSRRTYGVDQNMLNWAAWLRMHHHDPQWEQHVIKKNAWARLNFELWDTHNQWDASANTIVIDTTSLSISEIAYAINNWVTTLMSTHTGHAIVAQGFTKEDVVRIYTKCHDIGIEIWIDGGWGVDALLGIQTRMHDDLDIVIQQKDAAKFRKYFYSQSYEEIERDDTNDWNFVLADAQGREVNVYVISFDNDGNGICGTKEKNLFYPAESLSAVGLINDVHVKCLTADHQVQSYTGDEISKKDIHDIKLLCDKFNIACPAEYDVLTNSQPQSAFAVIYRGYLKYGMEEEYKDYWNKIASFFIKSRGAMGSCLHKTEDGMWIAYSKWPSKEMRDNAWPEDESVNQSFSEEINSAIIGLKHCLDPNRYLPEITMEVVNDLMNQ